MGNALKKHEDIHELDKELEALYPSKEEKCSSLEDGILSLKKDDIFGDKFQKTSEKNKNIKEEKEDQKDNEDEGVLLKMHPSAHHYDKHEENIGADSLPKTKQRKRTNTFYKVNNHHELFKVGSSFLKDFESGIHSFAISSTGYQTSQQKMILGLASFFDHKEHLKIAIVSENLFSGLFKDIVESSREETMYYDDGEASCNIYTFHEHFDFICLESLLEQNHQSEDVNYEERITEFKTQYDIIFWDVPELHKIQISPEEYYPMIMNFDCLSIIVAQALSKKEDIEELKSFFSGYGINLKGLIMDQNEKNKIKSHNSKKDNTINEKKPWWRFFK